MIRSAFAIFLVTATVGSATPALSQQDLAQPSAPGGLGNTRSDLDLVYGAVERTSVSDSGGYASDAVSYADEWVFYLIEDGTTPSPNDRVFIINRYADAFDSWTYPEAIAVANQLLPVDVVPTSDLLPYELTGPAFQPGTVLEYRQTFYSESIARLFPDPEPYRGGEPGTVWLLLTLDHGSVDPSSHFVTVSVRIEQPPGA